MDLLAIILIIIIIYWAFYCYKLLDKNIFLYLKYYKSLNIKEKEKYKIYLRNDIHKFNKTSLYIKAFFLLPIRMIGYTINIYFLFIILKLICIIFNIKEESLKFEQSKSLTFITRKLMSLSTKFSNYFFLNLNVTKKIIKSGNPSSKEEIKNCKLYISNHVSWIDSRYYISLDKVPSFMVDINIKKLPLYGFFSELNQNLFVNILSNKDKSKLIKNLNQRAQNFIDKKNFSPLLIFHEGMVKNTNYILPFKKGIFNLNLPIKLFCLDYRDNEIIPEMTLFDFNGTFLLPFLNFRNNITVYEYDSLIYPYKFLNLDGTIDTKKMAEHCRNIMFNSLKLEKIEMNNIYELNYEYKLFKIKRINDIKNNLKY